MATIAERLDEDYKTAMKARDADRVSAIRMLKAAFQQMAIEKRKDRLEDAEATLVLIKQVKQINETIEAATKAGREDAISKAKAELEILKPYMPEPISEEKLLALVDEAIQTAGDNRGQIMKYVMSKAGAGADGKRVNQLVAQRLKPASGS